MKLILTDEIENVIRDFSYKITGKMGLITTVSPRADLRNINS